MATRLRTTSCISFDSYIKPQLAFRNCKFNPVVYLLIPTSNHNYHRKSDNYPLVVYLLIPTSNHNEHQFERFVEELYIF